MRPHNDSLEPTRRPAVVLGPELRPGPLQFSSSVRGTLSRMCTMTSRRTATRIALLLFALASLGCRLGPESCDTGVEPAIDVVIADALTGAPLANNAAGLVEAGTFVDSLRPYRDNGTGQLISRATTRTPPGTYNVRVTHDGYEPWVLANVRVRAGACGMETRVLTAELQPVSVP